VVKTESTKAGISFSVIFNHESARAHGSDVRIADLMPEQLANATLKVTPETYTSVDSLYPHLLPGDSSRLEPGSPVAIQDAKLTIEGSVLRAAGEECAVAQIRGIKFRLRGLIPEQDLPTIQELVDQPISLLGALRYVPPYRLSGANALNVAVRVAAIWLQ